MLGCKKWQKIGMKQLLIRNKNYDKPRLQKGTK